MASRSLLQRPGFAVVVSVSLALGIGMSATIFGVVDRILLRPLDVRPLERLFEANLRATAGGDLELISYPNLPSYREAGEPVLDLEVHSSTSLTLRHGEVVSEVEGSLVSVGYFSLLEVSASLGRFFARNESESAVVVISWSLWQRLFGGDRGVLGESVVLNGEPFTIIGVAEPTFEGLYVAHPTDVWLPVATFPKVATGFLRKIDVLGQEGIRWLQPVGRLHRGVDLEVAQEVLATASQRIEDNGSRDTTEMGVVLTPLAIAAVGIEAREELERFLFLLAALVGLEFFVTCINIGGMFLVRGARQRKEAAVRLSLGASRSSLVRRPVIESLVLAALGWIGGILLARTLLVYLATLDLTGFRSLQSRGSEFDLGLYAFAALAAVLVTLSFGLLSAWRLSRIRPVEALKSQVLGTEPFYAGIRRFWLVGQVALTLVLLMATGAFSRTLVNAFAADPGFRTREVLQFEFHLGSFGYDEQRAKSFYSRTRERLVSVPGVLDVAWSAGRPLSPAAFKANVEVSGYVALPDESMEVRMNVVGPGFFETLGIAVRDGRSFEPRDRSGSPPVVIVNETMARRFWGAQSPIGHSVRLTATQVLEVIGVVADSKVESLQEEPVAQMYLPLEQGFGLAGLGRMYLLAYMDGEPAYLASATQEIVREIDPALPVVLPQIVHDSIKRHFMPQQLGALVFGLLSVFGVCMVAVGIYGLLATVVSQQTREIGLRMALGAQRGQIWRLIAFRSLSLVLVGVLIGSMSAGILLRFGSALLYGVGWSDPGTMIGASALLVFVALMASIFPAARAVGITPTLALHHD